MDFHVDANLLILLCVAALNAYTAYQTNRTRKDVEFVEKATNSMKDALVAATGAAARAEGHAQGLAEGLESKRPP